MFILFRLSFIMVAHLFSEAAHVHLNVQLVTRLVGECNLVLYGLLLLSFILLLADLNSLVFLYHHRPVRVVLTILHEVVVLGRLHGVTILVLPGNLH